MLAWSQNDLANKSGVSVRTLISFEAQKRAPQAKTLARLRAALEAAGIEFTNGDAPGVRLRVIPRSPNPPA